MTSAHSPKVIPPEVDSHVAELLGEELPTPHFLPDSPLARIAGEIKQPLPEDVRQRLMSVAAEEWVQSFALLLASGVSMEMASQRLNKPLRALKNIVELEEFNDLVLALGTEMKRDVTADLVKGSGVDNVMFLIRMRDNERAKPELRVRCAEFLLKLGYGQKLLSEVSNGQQSTVSDLVGKHGNLNGGVDAELNRFLDNNPGLFASLRPDHRPRLVPETGQQSNLPQSHRGEAG